MAFIFSFCRTWGSVSFFGFYWCHCSLSLVIPLHIPWLYFGVCVPICLAFLSVGNFALLTEAALPSGILMLFRVVKNSKVGADEHCQQNVFHKVVNKFLKHNHNFWCWWVKQLKMSVLAVRLGWLKHDFHFRSSIGVHAFTAQWLTIILLFLWCWRICD